MRGDSPRGGEMSRSDRGDRALFALDAERPEGWFLATNLTAVGWFLATNLTAVGWFPATNLTRRVVPHAGPKNQPNNGHVHPKKFIPQ